MVTNRQRYKEKVSQMVSWGHWFTLFNILFCLALGSRYLFVSDWPTSLAGRVYAFVSWLGHFSFITFGVYLLILFPLTFIVMSQRLMRVISAILATAGLTLLIIDSEVFSRFRLHLNPVVWDLFINPDEAEVSRDWQLLFISIPAIFLVQMLFGTWCWQKLRSLNRRHIGKPIALFFIIAFVSSHLTHIWADANFYRPITMQKSNFPLSYPMTARRFLEKHGLLDAEAYQDKINQQGSPGAMAVEYPLNKLSYQDSGSGYNLLMIVVDGIHSDSLDKDMPALANFASNNLQFTQHYSSGNRQDTGIFGLFYGISPTYLDGILAGAKPSMLIEALGHQGYQFGLFSTNGFNLPLYRQALFSDFSLPEPQKQSRSQITSNWKEWLDKRDNAKPWFSYIQYGNPELSNVNGEKTPTDFIQRYQSGISNTDSQISDIVNSLEQRDMLKNTIVVITATHGIEFNETGKNSWGSGQNFSRYQLQVPLIIHWPSITEAQKIDKLTGHDDIMTTLMQRLLRVKTAVNDYSQGDDLFTAKRRYQWISAGDTEQLVIISPDQTTVLNTRNGQYKIFNQDYQQDPHAKPQLAMLLQVLTEVKRFIAD